MSQKTERCTPQCVCPSCSPFIDERTVERKLREMQERDAAAVKRILREMREERDAGAGGGEGGGGGGGGEGGPSFEEDNDSVEATKFALYLQAALVDMGEEVGTVYIYGDNQAAHRQ